MTSVGGLFAEHVIESDRMGISFMVSFMDILYVTSHGPMVFECVGKWRGYLQILHCLVDGNRARIMGFGGVAYFFMETY